MHMIAAHGPQRMKETITRFSAKEQKQKDFRKVKGRRRAKPAPRRPKAF